ncbi:MAG: DUF1013 domain-containing protein [Holosporaceae bacterium]|nr:DUF1013 domain-containing protein [Holosporaceae bacterium]
MATPIMPQGTAVWLIENTSLTFEQIAQFCGLHTLEVQAIADEQISQGIIGVDPLKLGQLTKEEIERCTKDPTATLNLSPPQFQEKKKTRKKYIPLLKRHDRPDAIAWIVKFHPDIPDSDICSLLSTTKSMVLSIRDKTYARINELKPRDPVLLGFCSQMELDAAIAKIKKEEQ